MDFKEVEKAISDVKSELQEFGLNVDLVDVFDNGLVRLKLSGGRSGSSGKSCSMGRRNAPAKESGSLSREGAKLMLRDDLTEKVPDIKKVEII